MEEIPYPSLQFGQPTSVGIYDQLILVQSEFSEGNANIRMIWIIDQSEMDAHYPSCQQIRWEKIFIKSLKDPKKRELSDLQSEIVSKF